MSRPATPAERYRAHAVAFRLAQEMGCTPKEAEAHLAARAARANREATRERLEAGRQRLLAKMNPPLRPRLVEDDRPERDEPWMMRD